MKNIYAIVLLFSALFLTKVNYASHVPGGNITYECLGNNQFLIQLTIFEDCGTSFISNTPETISITNDCGIGGLTSASLNMVAFQQEVSQLCPSAQPQSECNGGSYPGIYMHVYEGVVTLPGQCDSWTFSFSDCCRNTSSNLVGSSSNYYFYADLNNLDAPCNNSPQFTAPPIPFSCVNQTVCYNFGIVETDGDSLSFALVNALTASGTSAPYQTGYSGANPIPGISIDPVTGQITFVATQIGNFVVSVQITEYDDNGNVIGVIIRDIQFEIINCGNQVVDCATSGEIFDLIGNVSQTGPTSLEMCENESFSFSIAFQDPDSNDSLSIISNIASVLPGSVIQVIHPDSASGQYDSVQVNIAWTPPVGSANTNNSFTITVNDNACPVSGQQTIVYYINVLGVTSVFADTTLCIGQTAQLVARADLATTYTWSVISGDPINMGANFSCGNNCDTAYASPSVTTKYLVTTDGACAFGTTDSVLVTVVPDYSYNLQLDDNTLCSGDTALMTLTYSPNGVYNIAWENQTGIIYQTSDTILVPSGNGTYSKPYMINDVNGCYKLDTLTYQVSSINLFNSSTDETCNGFADGTLIASGISGFPISGYSIVGPVSQTNTTGDFTGLAPGTYTVSVVDSNQCTTSTTITIGNGVVVDASSTTDSTTCSYLSDGLVQVSATSGNSPYSYTLSTLTGVLLDSNLTGLFTVGEGIYVYTAYDVNGCLFVDTAVVSAPLPVVASFSASEEWGVEPLTVSFTNNSQNASDYTWGINGTLSTDVNPVYTFNEGDYTISLIASNGVCSDTTSGIITVVANSYIIIPNIFTPDGNSVNDEFYIDYYRLSQFHVEIFNRWGTRLFESDDPDFKWDGTDKGGSKMSDGTYFYVITAVGDDKEEYQMQGTIMLIKD